MRKVCVIAAAAVLAIARTPGTAHAQWIPPDGWYEAAAGIGTLRIRIAAGKVERLTATFAAALDGNVLRCIGGAQPRELPVAFDAARSGGARPITSDDLSLIVPSVSSPTSPAGPGYNITANVGAAAVPGEAAIRGSVLFEAETHARGAAWCREFIRPGFGFLARRVTDLAGQPVTNTVDSAAMRAAAASVRLTPRTIHGSHADSAIYLVGVAPDQGRGQLFRAPGPDSNFRQISRQPFVSGAAVHPTRPATLFVVSDRALHRSDDGGAAWKRLAVPLPDVSVVAVSPANPAVVFAAQWTGQLARSQDGGETWVALRERGDWAEVVPHPTNPGVVFAIAGRGDNQRALRSDDAGTSWRQLQRTWAIQGFAVDPGAPDVLYLVVRRTNRYGEVPQLLRSTDGGRAWSEVARGPFTRLVVEPETGELFIAGDNTIRRMARGTSVVEPAGAGLPPRFEALSFATIGPRRVLYATIDIRGNGPSSESALFRLDGAEWRRVLPRVATADR
jgi:hypothetical protein